MWPPNFRTASVVKVRGAAFPIKCAKLRFLSVYTVAPSLSSKDSCHLFFIIHVSLPTKYGAETGACHFNLECDTHHEVHPAFDESSRYITTGPVSLISFACSHDTCQSIFSFPPSSEMSAGCDVDPHCVGT